MGKLSISRGSQLAKPEETRLSLVPAHPVPQTIRAVEHSPVQDLKPLAERLELLERLARLRAQELLSAEEYAAEKAALIGATQDGTKPDSAARAASAGPSLLGRLFSWKLLPLGLVAGIALSFGAQPQETMRFVDQALGRLGA
jgi:hypothetical protein